MKTYLKEVLAQAGTDGPAKACTLLATRWMEMDKEDLAELLVIIVGSNSPDCAWRMRLSAGKKDDERLLNWIMDNTSADQFFGLTAFMRLATYDNMPEWMTIFPQWAAVSTKK